MSRQYPWRAGNPDALIVSRGAGRVWGNPFEVGGWYVMVDGVAQPTRFPQFHEDATQIPNRATAVAMYREHISRMPAVIESAKRVLGGYDLACWCPLDEPCHADVLLELANAGCPSDG